MSENVQLEYGWESASHTEAHEYLVPKVLSLLPPDKFLKVLDIGCGNGYLAGCLSKLGHTVTAVDASADGIKIAENAFPDVHFRVLSIYDAQFEKVVGGQYNVVVSLEVIEHLYWPRQLLSRAYGALEMGGVFIISTPYHGYLKNILISLLNGWDRHFTVNWDGGHIKFFSKKTLSKLLIEQGFQNVKFYGVGRIPLLWKSMILVVEK